MKFNLSVVNTIPDAHKDAMNQIAELCGCGSNNLSVKLVDSKGAKNALYAADKHLRKGE